MITFRAGRVERRLRSISRTVETQKDRLFRIPLNNTLRSLRALVRFDANLPDFWPRKTHVDSGNLLRNTRVETQRETPEEIRLGLGFFVDYGLNLEQGSPDHDPGFDRLLLWAQRKGFGARSAAVAAGLRRNLDERGSRGHDLIQRTWEANRDDYREEVLNRFGDLFR